MLFTQTAATTSTSLPVVVAQRSFIGETTNIPPTTIFTPTSKGLFRVTVDLEQSNTDAGTYAPAVFLSWTGDFASYQTQMVIGPNYQSGSAAAGSDAITVRDAANAPVQISTTLNPNEEGTYNLYVVIEKL